MAPPSGSLSGFAYCRAGRQYGSIDPNTTQLSICFPAKSAPAPPLNDEGMPDALTSSLSEDVDASDIVLIAVRTAYVILQFPFFRGFGKTDESLTLIGPGQLKGDAFTRKESR
jgi:hypothetical protein